LKNRILDKGSKSGDPVGLGAIFLGEQSHESGLICKAGISWDRSGRGVMQSAVPIARPDADAWWRSIGMAPHQKKLND